MARKSNIEIGIASRDPVLQISLRGVMEMPEGPDKDEVIGKLLVHLGVLWQTHAAVARAYPGPTIEGL